MIPNRKVLQFTSKIPPNCQLFVEFFNIPNLPKTLENQASNLSRLWYLPYVGFVLLTDQNYWKLGNLENKNIGANKITDDKARAEKNSTFLA